MRKNHIRTLIVIFLTLFSGQLPAAEDQNSDYSFDPSNTKRDPFLPLISKDSNSKSSLLSYEVVEMKLLATLIGEGAPRALVSLPNGTTHIVRVGLQIGKHKGKVIKITQNEVSVRESFRDLSGKSKSNITTLVLAE